MTRVARQLLIRLLALVACAALILPAGPAAAQAGRFDRPSLDSMLAPIALYPDALLSHVLMAATYPEEVEDAANWLRARPGLSGDAAVRTADDQDWDPAVRSLLAFPMVLETLASHLRWTADVGNAFLYQREEVMDAIQGLRRRAYDAGTLRSNEAVRVTAGVGGFAIEQAVPETVYIPYYDPRVAYGGWWWPSRPPMYWSRWSGWADPVPRGHYLAWGPGIHISSGFFFGGFVWPRHEVRVVNVRPYYYPRRVVVERHIVPGRSAPVIVHRDASPGVWRHHDWRRDRDGRDHDRRDWRDNDRRDARDNDRRDNDRRDARDNDRRENDRRAPVTTRTEPREGPRTGFAGVPREGRPADRDGDGVPDRSRRLADRDGDGVPDRRGAGDARRDERSGQEWRTQQQRAQQQQQQQQLQQQPQQQRRDQREEARTPQRAAERPNAQNVERRSERQNPPREGRENNARTTPRQGDRD